MGRKYSDNALTTLASSISDADTQLTVATGKGDQFPEVTGSGVSGSAPDFFVITMEDAAGNREKIRCEHRAAASDVMGSASYPLIRGYDGTVARAWDAGDLVDLRWEMKAAQEVSDDIDDLNDNALRKDGSVTSTANQPMGGFKHTDVADASALDQYPSVGQVQDGGFYWCGTAGGTGNAITLTPSPAIAGYAAGQRFGFIASAANTGTTTVNVSGKGAKSLLNFDYPVVSGEIAAGRVYEIVYDGAAFNIVGGPLAHFHSQNFRVRDAVDQTKRLVFDLALLGTGTDYVLAVAPEAGSHTVLTRERVASTGDMEAASVTDKYVAPNVQHRHPGHPKAWVKFVGSTGVIEADYGVDSIDDDGTGNFGVNWTTAFSSDDYAVVATALNAGVRQIEFDAIAAGSADLVVRDSAHAQADATAVFVIACGDHV